MVEACERYYYPDLTLTCGAPVFETKQGLKSLVNPTVIFEVLSPATEMIDRGEKFECYQEIATLFAYVLIAQHTAQIEIWIRDAGDIWRYQQATELEAEVVLSIANCTLRLADIYENVVFPGQPNV